MKFKFKKYYSTKTMLKTCKINDFLTSFFICRGQMIKDVFGWFQEENNTQ